MKKIMFNDKYGLTAAVFEGRKTMTRRVISLPDTWHGIEVYGFSHVKGQATLELTDGDDFIIEDPNTGQVAQVLPTYKIGEEVAVAQSYFNIYGERQIDGSIVKWCKANGKDFREEIRTMEALKETAGYDNKMFVRADLMPHRIRITGIKVEQLHDISSEDCLREGIEARVTGCHTFYYIHGEERPYNFPKQAFAALIDKVSGRGTWDENPYVFAYTFETINP